MALRRIPESQGPRLPGAWAVFAAMGGTWQVALTRNFPDLAAVWATAGQIWPLPPHFRLLECCSTPVRSTCFKGPTGFPPGSSSQHRRFWIRP